MFLTIIIFVIVLSVLVFAHELGHFFVARKCGVKAEEFGFGFPPRIFGFYKSKEGKWKKVIGAKEVSDAKDTIYSINWVPLGGFVKIKGENGEVSEAEAMAEKNDNFVSHPIWQRALILSAGVAMNIVLAFVLISIGLMIGMPQSSLDNLDKNAKIINRSIEIVQVLENSPAAKNGIQPGDIITGINGSKFTTYPEVQNFTDANTGKVLVYEISRGGKSLFVSMTPEKIKEIGKGGIGVAIIETGVVRYPVHIAIWEGAKKTVMWSGAILEAFYHLIKGLVTGTGNASESVSGPVGIASLTGQAARLGFVYLLQFTAMLSINLAIINFLPFPALDGGRVLFLIIEKLKGKPVRRELEAIIHNAGFAVLMVLILFVTFKDIMKFSGVFKVLWSKIAG